MQHSKKSHQILSVVKVLLSILFPKIAVVSRYHGELHHHAFIKRKTQSHNGRNVVYYKCTDHKVCPARGKLDKRKDRFTVTREHIHSVQKEVILRMKTLNNLKKELLANPLCTLKETYDNVSTRRKSSLGEDFNVFTLLPFKNVRTML